MKEGNSHPKKSTKNLIRSLLNNFNYIQHKCQINNIINLFNFDFDFLRYCFIFINNSKRNGRRNDFFHFIVMFNF